MMKMAITTLATLLVFLSTGQSIASVNTLRTVVLSGDVAPGTSDEFLGFNIPTLNDNGQTAFIGWVNSSGTTNEGVWSEGGGSGLALVAREGNTAPGTSNRFAGSGPVSAFDTGGPAFNNLGQTAFFGFLANNDGGIWSDRGGNGLALVASRGTTAAPGTGGTFSGVSTPVLNNAGQTAFYGAANNDSGIWSDRGGNGLALVVREGTTAPGTSGSFSRFSRLAINDAGQMAFAGSLNSSTSNDHGIWSEGGGSGLALVARRGGAAPGTSDSFRYLHSLTFNNAGQTAFIGWVNSSGTTNEGVWSEGGGSGLALVARVGDAAPGTSDSFAGFHFNGLAFNNAGQIAFFGNLSSSRFDNGIWSESGGNGLALVARVGDTAPGTGGNFSQVSPPVLNEAGQVAFIGTSNNRSGVWAEDRLGVLRLIVNAGQLLDVDDGPGTDFRTIASFGYFGGQRPGDIQPSGFNNLGQLAFRASFTDGTSGVFVSNIATIPEPSALLLAALAVMGILSVFPKTIRPTRTLMA